MHRSVSRAVGLTAWAGAAYGALLLAAVPGEYGHDWCGPWGCFPPLQALAAMHLFWAVLLAPPVVWACRRCSPTALHRLGVLLLTLGVLGVAVVVTREALTWLPSAAPGYRRYFARRVAYALATATDFPMVQIAAAGATCWVVARRRVPRPEA